MRRWHLTILLFLAAAGALWLGGRLPERVATPLPPEGGEVVVDVIATPPAAPAIQAIPELPVVPPVPTPPLVALPPDPPPTLYAGCAGLTEEPVDCGRG